MAGNILSVALWVCATDFRTFLASRVVGGLSEGNVQLATAMAADISSEEERGSTMAIVGVCFSVAFTVGPALGAALSQVEVVASNPFAVAAGVSLGLIVVETVYLYLYLPETRPPPQQQQSIKDKKTAGAKRPDSTTTANGKVEASTTTTTTTTPTSHQGQQVKQQHNNPPWLLNTTHLLFLLIFSGMEFSFPFLTYDLFLYPPSRTGSLLSFIGLLASLLQGTVTRRLPPLTVVRIGVISCTCAFFLLSTPNLNQTGLWAGAAMLAVTTATVVTGLSSLSSFEARRGEMGGSLGRHRSWGQVGRALGPVVFCSLYWWVGREVVYRIGGVGMLGVVGIVFGGLRGGGGGKGR